VRLSVIVISYDRPEELIALLESLLRQEGKEDVLEEVLLLDNGSTRDYARVRELVAAHPELRATLQRSETNAGVSARNRLVSEARGDALLMLDDDVVLGDPRSLVQLSDLLEEPFFADARCAAVSVRVVRAGTDEIQRSVFPHKRFGRYSMRSRFLTSYFNGCAYVIRRAAFEVAGPLPEDFFYAMEEYDLAYRLVRAGYTLGYDDSVTVEHKESPAGRQPNATRIRMQWVNKSKVAWRYLPRRYFATTALLWSVNYLRRTRGDLRGFFQGLSAVIRIPTTERRDPIGREGLEYLASIDARLWW
jgi:GT2 family glycosyltransferase